MMNLVISGGGARPDETLLREACGNADAVLAADSGAQWLMECGIVPDVLLGDFDSISPGILNILQNNGRTRWIRHRTDKDQTDMELCVEEAIRLGASKVSLFSAIGSRIDHSLANLFLLHPFLKKGIEAWVVDIRNRVTMVGRTGNEAGPFQIRLARMDGYKVSLISMGACVSEITTSGLQYDMRGRDLLFGSTLGISNEFASKEAEIRFRDGLLMVLLSRD
jgi:thiamine pyrophosphokinase